MPPQRNEQIVIGRAKNAMLSFFEQRLSVPKIYLDADWDGQKVDVLAIDRDGIGDVSVAIVIEVVEAAKQPLELIARLRSIPAHFKYLVVVADDFTALDTEDDRKLEHEASKSPIWFAEDGVGRIGSVRIDFRGERPTIAVSISAERFRSNQHIYDLADAFASSHTADFEVREISW